MTTAKKIFVLLFFASISAMAQTEDCETTLSKAEDEFEAGHFYIIPAMLNNCLSQFTKEQRQRAYVLLSQTYLLLDDPIGAKQSYLQLLQANPEFQTDTSAHPIDFIYLSRKFTSTAIFSWYVKAGSNVSPIRVIYDLDAFGQANAKEEYKLMAGYQAGVGGDLYITEQIGLRAELNLAITAYKHRSFNYFRSTTYSTSDTKEVTDRQSWISLPLMLSYSDNSGKYRPYGYAGYSVHYLLTDRASIITTDQQPGLSENIDTGQESPTFNFIYKRNRLNQSIVAGGGVKLKVGLDFLFVDVRYNLGLKNLVDPEGTYADYKNNRTQEQQNSTEFIQSQEAATGYGHVEDYFRMDNFSLSVGFLRPLYKPRELRKPRTGSFFRRIF
jgi:hypothetical protein